jgi:hypothetical protein
MQNPDSDNYHHLKYGGIGILVLDMDHGHRLLPRIPSWGLAAGEIVEIPQRCRRN